MGAVTLCEMCAPEGAHISDVIENPFATCDRCGIAADDAGALLEVRSDPMDAETASLGDINDPAVAEWFRERGINVEEN